VKELLKYLVFKHYQPLKRKLMLPVHMRNWGKYAVYDSEEFIKGVQKVGIELGDSVFIMCSVKKIYLKTGHYLPIERMLADLLGIIGTEGTLMVLGFSDCREMIVNGTAFFDLSKTSSKISGSLSESIRRNPNSVRSLQPIFSALAIGKKAKEYCNSHHLSPFPFDENSPFRKLTDDGGKFLAIGQGIESFTPSHMIEDHFKQGFKHWVYNDHPIQFKVKDGNGEYEIVSSYIRGPFNKMLDLQYHFGLLGIESKTCVAPKCGIKLFYMDMKEYFQSSIDLYNEERTTIWSTVLPDWMDKSAHIYRKIKLFL
jgi:aminoglycoside N3'-acetyltransferase